MPNENRKLWEKFKSDNPRFDQIGGAVKQDLGPNLDNYDKCFDKAEKQIKEL